LEKIREKTKSKLHKIILSGLLPETIYNYTILPGSSSGFHFRTAPRSTSSFRFAVLDSDYGEVEELYVDFILILAEPSQKVSKTLYKKWSSVPVFHKDFRFEWGNSYVSSVIPDFNNLKKDIVFLCFSDSLRPDLISGKCPVIRFKSNDVFKLDSLEGIKDISIGKNPVIVEVNGFDVSAFRAADEEGGMPSLIVNSSTLSYKKTCIYCRRLLENKKYRESIKWYRRFLIENRDEPDQYLLDDALFAIGDIFDNQLFEYDSAISEYQRLIREFPASKNTRLAGMRLNYIKSHREFNYQPLKVFEKARTRDISMAGVKAASEVEIIIKKYPGSGLIPDMLLWLGNVYRTVDYKKSVDFFLQLYNKFPSTDMGVKAIRLAGDTYYQHKYYKKALRIFGQIKEKKLANVDIKIERCKRNIIRDILLYFCISVLVLYFIILGIKSPRGFGIAVLKTWIKYLFFYLCAGAVPVFIWRQYFGRLMGFVGITACCIALVPASMAVVKDKFKKVHWSLLPVIAVTATMAVLFIIFYYYHFLFLFKI
ncbi:MAG: tetratricopeptide repeat protein, partial [bacterium]